MTDLGTTTWSGGSPGALLPGQGRLRRQRGGGQSPDVPSPWDASGCKVGDAVVAWAAEMAEQEWNETRWETLTSCNQRETWMFSAHFTSKTELDGGDRLRDICSQTVSNTADLLGTE